MQLCDYEQKLRSAGVLETQRLYMRNFVIEDAQDMFEYASDAEVTRYLTWKPYTCVQDCENFIKQVCIGNQFQYVIVTKDENKCIGAFDIRIEPQHNKASFGYVLNRKFWGNGYMTETLAKILEVCFEQLDLNRVESTHYVGDKASGKVMQKCGMRLEGVSPQEQYVLGKYVDVVRYGILREWYFEKTGRG